MAKGDGVSIGSARWMALKAVINSTEGKAAMMKAIEAGKPPLCGVDALLTAIIIDYRDKDDQILRSAGSLVAEAMRVIGYVQGSVRSCPEGCTIGTATAFAAPIS